MEESNEFESEFEAGTQSLYKKDFTNAELHFLNAHKVGHNIKRDHLKTHAAMVKLGWLKKSPSIILSQSVLYVLAAIFEKNSN